MQIITLRSAGASTAATGGENHVEEGDRDKSDEKTSDRSNAGQCHYRQASQYCHLHKDQPPRNRLCSL